MIVTLGGRFGGYGLYLLKGKPVFTYNLMGLETLPLGRPAGAHAGQTHHRVRLQTTTARAWARAAPACCRWTVKDVDTKTIPHTIPLSATADETFDVGMDTRTSVDDNDYQPPFRFNGTHRQVDLQAHPAAAHRQSKRSSSNKRRRRPGTPRSNP